MTFHLEAFFDACFVHDQSRTTTIFSSHNCPVKSKDLTKKSVFLMRTSNAICIATPLRLFSFLLLKFRKRDEPMTHEMNNLSIIDLEGSRDEFVSDNEPEERSDHLAHWLADDDLKNSETETLPATEEQFWLDLIQKYLLPIEPSDDEKVFGNHSCSDAVLIFSTHLFACFPIFMKEKDSRRFVRIARRYRFCVRYDKCAVRAGRIFAAIEERLHSRALAIQCKKHNRLRCQYSRSQNLS